MSALSIREQTFIHALKALTDGEFLSDTITRSPTGQSDSPDETSELGTQGASAESHDSVDRVPFTRDCTAPISADRSQLQGGAAFSRGPSFVYTDPEDIPFGEDSPPPRLKRSEQVIVLRWTWNKGRILKTKAAGNRKMSVWRKWYERQGWRVFGAASSGQLIARSPDGELHAITLRVHAKPRQTTQD